MSGYLRCRQSRGKRPLRVKEGGHWAMGGRERNRHWGIFGWKDDQGGHHRGHIARHCAIGGRFGIGERWDKRQQFWTRSLEATQERGRSDTNHHHQRQQNQQARAIAQCTSPSTIYDRAQPAPRMRRSTSL